MKHLLLLLLVVLLASCGSPDYEIISENRVDGYYIYEKQHRGLFCNQEFEIVFYSGPEYNYGYRFQGCDPSMTYFILTGDEYLHLQAAINEGIISIESLLPELDELVRQPEPFESDEADYYWLDFHIMGEVVYAYAGGPCDQVGEEFFEIDGTSYVYEASGCLQDHILFIRRDGEDVPVATLLAQGEIDGRYLIPLLTPVTD